MPLWKGVVASIKILLRKSVAASTNMPIWKGVAASTKILLRKSVAVSTTLASQHSAQQ